MEEENTHDCDLCDVSSRRDDNARRDLQTFQATAPNALGLAGLLRKNYWLSEDGERAGGIYVWESREVADKIYTPEWAALMEGMYGTPPMIEHVNSPVMADNRDRTISIAA